MPIPSSDDSRPDTVNDNYGSRRISREIASLQQEIRDDFDQKLRELSGLMLKFKSLLANDGQLGPDQQTAANEATLDDGSINVSTFNEGSNEGHQSIDKAISDVEADIPMLTDRITDDTTSEIDKPVSAQDEKSESSGSNVTPITRYSTEPARFESGLYQLNSQLYRFKLELDQELEYREEPLHIHFQHQSELAKVLQQITEKMQQEKNTGR